MFPLDEESIFFLSFCLFKVIFLDEGNFFEYIEYNVEKAELFICIYLEELRRELY
jgi:hypothetical protein